MKRFLPAGARRACSALLCFLLPSLALADASLVKRLDPTDFRTRIEIRDRIVGPQFGGLRNVLIPRIDYAFSKTFSLRVELPVATWDPYSPRFDAQTGMGDVAVRAALRVLRTEHLALVGGVEAILDTASDAILGYGRNVIAPFAFVSVRAPTLRTTFFPGLQHFRSVDDGDFLHREVNYTQAKFYALTQWPARFYTGAEAVFIVDHVRNNRVGATFDIEGGRFLNKHVAAWVRPGVGVAGDDILQIQNWSVEVGLRYLFD